ncbi:phosphatidate cytidylyltransferase [Algicola sagamiensis]|uniref:phosphatidate cytidylyltransferase n=1 Tax=Algicola sagamiensis TaxID=163869 RepID=UPI00037CF5D2|nr:phosphatidate cytidylyltransferase [Algicola sagamiensis]
MLKQRIITALILAPLVLAGIFYLPISGFQIFAAAIILLGAWEFGPLYACKDTLPSRLAFCGATGLGILAMALGIPTDVIWQSGELNIQASYILGLGSLWWTIALLLILIFPKGQRVWRKQQLVRAIFGLLTFIPAWMALVVLRTSQMEIDLLAGAWLIFIVLGIVWAADVGGYVVGKAMGKHKLIPKVSPGKTIEGFLGALGFVGLYIVLLLWFVDIEISRWALLIGAAFLVTVVSVVGDLTESMFKRHAGVKDSGSILPGHGGVLDRIDSLLAASPVFALLYSVLI